MINTFNGYGNFRDIKSPLLRSWNRVNTYYNIRESHGKVVAMKYLEQFKNELGFIAPMFAEINSIGYEQVRRNIMRGRQ